MKIYRDGLLQGAGLEPSEWLAIFVVPPNEHLSECANAWLKRFKKANLWQKKGFTAFKSRDKFFIVNNGKEI